MTWRGEFGEDWAVPELIDLAEALPDTSWHNDVCPSFSVEVQFAGDEYGVYVTLWVDHPDPARREYGWRYSVGVSPCGPAAEQAFLAVGVKLEPWGDMEWQSEDGDDERAALAKFMSVLATVRAVAKGAA